MLSWHGTADLITASITRASWRKPLRQLTVNGARRGSRNLVIPARRVKKAKPPGSIAGRPAPTNAPQWPIEILQTAHNEGKIRIGPTQAIALLNEIWKLTLAQNFSRTKLEPVLGILKINPAQLTDLAQVLIFCVTNKTLASLGFDLLFISSELGDKNAALTIVDYVLEHKNSDLGVRRYQGALDGVKKLANQNDLQSLVLLGKVHLDSEELQEAFSLFQKAIRVDVTDMPYEEIRPALAEAWRNCARIASQRKGIEQTILKAFETAALEYEDPYSFYYLARMRGPEDQRYVEYLTKAAISGISEACYELGVHHSRLVDEAKNLNQDLGKKIKMAAEWFALAKHHPEFVVRSYLHMKRLEELDDPIVPQNWTKIDKRQLTANAISKKMMDAVENNWIDSGSVISATLLEQLLPRNG